MKLWPFVALSLFAVRAEAQATPDSSRAPVTWHALMMSSYQYDTHDPASGTLPLRVFDPQHHAWRFDLAGLAIARAAAPIGFELDLVSGADAPVMASLGAADPGSVDFTQAYLAFKPHLLHGVELRGGKFTTTAGYEVIPTWDNVNVTQSRSFLFGYAIPFTHTGVRALIPVSPHAALVLGVNRGWDKWKDNNGALSTELALTVTPSARWTLALDTHRGPEQDGDRRHQRHLLDLTATFQATPRLLLGVNGDRGTEEAASIVTPGADAEWSGWALYARTDLAARWALGARVERFDDHDGSRTGLAQRLADVDLTLDWASSPHLLLRADARADHSDHLVFDRGGSPASARARTTLAFTAVLRR